MTLDVNDFFCHDLPSVPRPEMGTILVTGGTGYIGGRLIPELLERGYRVRVMVRKVSPDYMERWPGAEIVTGDALDYESLKNALDGIHTAYYLIHSMRLGSSRFEQADLQAAINFRKASEEKNIRRIIYLGALGDVQSSLSRHLRSRMHTAMELSKGIVPVTMLRAGIIIGSGSASYEIIKHLTRNAPFILVPKWAKNECQPISVRDVIKYLVGVLELPETSGQAFDIGGSDIHSYESMMKIFAEIIGIKRLFIPSPAFGIKCIAYVASILTPVPAQIAMALIQGVKNEAVCQNHDIHKYLPFNPISYKEAVLRAMTREEQDKVHTRWSDAYPPAHTLALKLSELRSPPRFMETHSLVSKKDASSLFAAICKIGGTEGWFHNNWMWRLRGMLDRIFFMGVGSSRGRRSSKTLRINDVLDFWRVENLVVNSTLLLRAEMMIPGRAWLEFNISPEGEGIRLSVTGYFQSIGICGAMYWYIFKPFHFLIFKNLIEQIDKRA